MRLPMATLFPTSTSQSLPGLNRRLCLLTVSLALQPKSPSSRRKQVDATSLRWGTPLVPSPPLPLRPNEASVADAQQSVAAEWLVQDGIESSRQTAPSLLRKHVGCQGDDPKWLLPV